MRLAWATDIHLNFLSHLQARSFFWKIAEAQPDAVVLTGDIAEAPNVEEYLTEMAEHLQRPIYFVLGNHDFYGGSIADVRHRMAEITATHRWLRWMNAAGVVPLTEETALVGHDGWADGRLGHGAETPVMLNDFFHIRELIGLSTEDRFARLGCLGDEAAAHFREVLLAAFTRFRTVVLLTHVPPFREACWHDGQISGDDWLPLFASLAPGEVLRSVMSARPDRKLIVLCGHTHGEGYADILPNLRVLTGGADYGAPQLQPELVVS
jgi:predicted MPP superfamily phosphohydrolase